jgi:hypothetical protein
LPKPEYIIYIISGRHGTLPQHLATLTTSSKDTKYFVEFVELNFNVEISFNQLVAMSRY